MFSRGLLNAMYYSKNSVIIYVKVKMFYVKTFLYLRRSYRRPLNYRKNVNNLLGRDASFLQTLKFSL